MRDTLTAIGVVALAAVCCFLPLLIVGGIGVLGSVVWREVALGVAGAIMLGLAFAGAVVMTRRRHG
jgi:predicted membrane metal-binding protein